MVSFLCLYMYYFDMIFRKDMHIDHSDVYFVASVYHDSVLGFRFGAFSLNILFRVAWSLLLKVALAFSGVTVLTQSGEMVINQGP